MSEESRPIPVTVRGPALRPGRCLPVESHLIVSVADTGTVRLSVIGGESTWIDVKPDDAAEVARLLGPLPNWINAAEAEPGHCYVVPSRIQGWVTLYFDGGTWRSRGGSASEFRPGARVFGPIPLDEEARQPGSES